MAEPWCIEILLIACLAKILVQWKNHQGYNKGGTLCGDNANSITTNTW